MLGNHLIIGQLGMRSRVTLANCCFSNFIRTAIRELKKMLYSWYKNDLGLEGAAHSSSSHLTDIMMPYQELCNSLR